MSYICPNCQTPIEENVKFCPTCGQKVVKDQESPTTETNEPVQGNDTSNACPLGNPEFVNKPENAENPIFTALTDFTMNKCTLDSLNVTVILLIVFAVIDFIVGGNALFGFSGFLEDLSDGLTEAIPAGLFAVVGNVALAFLFMHLNKVLFTIGMKQAIYNILILLTLVVGVIFLFPIIIGHELSDESDTIIELISWSYLIVMFIVGYKIGKVVRMSWLSKVVMAYPVIAIIIGLSLSEITLLFMVAAKIILPLTMKSVLTPYYQEMKK